MGWVHQNIFLAIFGEKLHHVSWMRAIITKIEIHSNCEIEDLVETHLCKLMCDTSTARITHICTGLLYAWFYI